MNDFARGAFGAIFLVWVLPALLTGDYRDAGPYLALIYGYGFWCLFVLLTVPLIGGLWSNGWKLTDSRR